MRDLFDSTTVSSHTLLTRCTACSLARSLACSFVRPFFSSDHLPFIRINRSDSTRSEKKNLLSSRQSAWSHWFTSHQSLSTGQVFLSMFFLLFAPSSRPYTLARSIYNGHIHRLDVCTRVVCAPPLPPLCSSGTTLIWMRWALDEWEWMRLHCSKRLFFFFSCCGFFRWATFAVLKNETRSTHEQLM